MYNNYSPPASPFPMGYSQETLFQTSIFASAALGASGWLGAHIIKVFNPSIAPGGHFLALGFTIPCALGLYALTKTVDNVNEIAKIALSVLGGYLAAVLISNRMGFPVGVVAPFVSLTVLACVGSMMVIPAVCVAVLAGVNLAAFNPRGFDFSSFRRNDL